MKSEWLFPIEVRGFRFEREHKYSVNPEQPVSLGNQPPKLIECLVRITPNEAEPAPNVDQLATMYVLLPGAMEDTRVFAYQIALMVAERISFKQGDLKIKGGFLSCERIPETPEEEEEIGEDRFCVEMKMMEMLPTPVFDSSLLTQTPLMPKNHELISQFNDTMRDNSPIRQFLGFFKILESIYHVKEKKKLTLKQVLLSSPDLEQIYNDIDIDDSYETLIVKLVEIRHRCAHLKLTSGFGYSPIDPDVKEIVKPLIPIVSQMAFRSIEG